MKMYGSLSDEDLNEWERLPSVMRVLCSAQMGAWLLRRDENKEKSEHRTGQWMKEGQGGRYKWMCSNCGTHHRALYDYCPSCGTRMESEDKDSK